MNIVIDIEEKWNSDMSAEPRLYLSDDPKELISLTSEGHFAVPVLTDKKAHLLKRHVLFGAFLFQFLD